MSEFPELICEDTGELIKLYEGNSVVETGYDWLREFAEGKIRWYTLPAVNLYTSVVLNWLRQTSGDKPLILDMGCNTGAAQRILQNTPVQFRTSFGKWPRYIGIDSSIEKLEYAQKFNYRMGRRLICTEIGKTPIPLKDNSVDLALFLDVLEHMPADMGVYTFNELFRVMKSGANLLFSTPNRDYLDWKHLQPSVHPCVWSFSELKQLIAKTKFIPIGTVGWELATKSVVKQFTEEQQNEYKQMIYFYGHWLAQFYAAFNHPELSSEVFFVLRKP